MNYLTANWGYPWFSVLMVLLIVVHERGLRSLNRRSTKAHARRRRRRLWFSYGGLVVLALSVSSPLQFWAMEYFWVHMLQHVTVMLAAPALYVAGAPWLSLVHAVPVGPRRRLMRRIFVRATRHPLRRLLAFLVSPWVGVIFFNIVMVFWMLPVFFNPIMTRPDLHIGLMLSTFFVSGLLFWIQFIPSAPLRPKLSPAAQVGSLLATNLIMTVIAIVISFLVSVPSYDFGAMMMNMGNMSMPVITLNRLADQQIGAAILWVCGDFWCFPALTTSLRRLMRDGDGPQVIDRLIRGNRTMNVEEFRRGRAASLASSRVGVEARGRDEQSP
ncbi:MAG: cytochrome c oxidase assembly protein [Acidimicrobiales bacterium]